MVICVSVCTYVRHSPQVAISLGTDQRDNGDVRNVTQLKGASGQRRILPIENMRRGPHVRGRCTFGLAGPLQHIAVLGFENAARRYIPRCFAAQMNSLETGSAEYIQATLGLLTWIVPKAHEGVSPRTICKRVCGDRE